jgi:hypothetical protein
MHRLLLVVVGTSAGLTLRLRVAVQDEHEDRWQDVGKRGKGRKKGRPGSGGGNLAGGGGGGGAANRYEALPRRARGT